MGRPSCTRQGPSQRPVSKDRMGKRADRSYAVPDCHGAAQSSSTGSAAGVNGIGGARRTIGNIRGLPKDPFRDLGRDFEDAEAGAGSEGQVADYMGLEASGRRLVVQTAKGLANGHIFATYSLSRPGPRIAKVGSPGRRGHDGPLSAAGCHSSTGAPCPDHRNAIKVVLGQ